MSATEIVTLILSYVSLAIAGKVFSLLLIFGMIFTFYKMNKDPSNSIDINDLFADANGKIGGSKMRLNIAFIISSWILVYYTLNGQLSEWLFTAFLGAFVIDRISARTTDATAPPEVKQDQ